MSVFTTDLPDVTIFVVDDEEEDTDPQPFGPTGREVTVRRCLCGREVDQCAKCESAFQRGAATVLNAAYREWTVSARLKGMPLEEAEKRAREAADYLAKAAGIDLI